MNLNKIKFNNNENQKISYKTIKQKKITKEHILRLNEQYPPLTDNIPVELKQPFEYENQSIYYGEWVIGQKISFRQGRGIQI